MFKSKRQMLTESVPIIPDIVNDSAVLWEEVDRQLEFRGKLLEQAIKFHQMAQIVIKFKLIFSF